MTTIWFDGVEYPIGSVHVRLNDGTIRQYEARTDDKTDALRKLYEQIAEIHAQIEALIGDDDAG